MSKDIREIIEEAVLGITQENLVKKDSGEIPSLRCTARQLKDKQIQNAIARYASSCRKNEMVVLCDTSVMGNGKSGILFSTEGMYCSDLNFLRKKNPIPVPIRYSELQSVERDGSNIWLNYKDGQKERVYGSIYAGFIVLALQKILTEIRAEKQVETFVESISEPEPAPIPVQEPTPVPTPVPTLAPDVEEILKRKNPFVEESAEEQFQKAMTAYKNGDFGTAADLYQRAAERGHVNASLCLGLVYDLGEGREKSMEEAFRWYRIAAEKGNSSGMYNTACCYAKGEGTEKDLKKALYWAKQAKDNGDADADAIIESLEKMMRPEPVVEAKPAPAPEPMPVPEPRPVVEEEVNSVPLPIQPEKRRMRDWRKDMPSKAKVREYVDIPKPGSVSMWGDSYFVVLAKKEREVLNMETLEVRSLSTGKIDTIDIWFSDPSDKPINFLSAYQTVDAKPDAIWYEWFNKEEKENVKYPVMDCEIRTCQYIGKYKCKDLLSGVFYEFGSNKHNKEDLDKAVVGDIALVCRFQRNAYFLGTYQREEGACLFYKNCFVKQEQSGEIPLNEVVALYGQSGEVKKAVEEERLYSYIGGGKLNEFTYSEYTVTSPAYVLTEVDEMPVNAFEHEPANSNNVDSSLKQITKTAVMMYMLYEEGYCHFIDTETGDIIKIEESLVPLSLDGEEVVQVTYTMDVESKEIIQADVVLIEE